MTLLSYDTKAQAPKGKLSALDYMKGDKFGESKILLKRVKRQLMEQGKIFLNDLFSKGLTLRINKVFP